MYYKRVVGRAALGLENALTAVASEALAPRPYTVSVGKATNPPDNIMPEALIIRDLSMFSGSIFSISVFKRFLPIFLLFAFLF